MDFRRLGLSVSEVGASVTYGEAAALVRELARRWDSHYTAAIQGWKYVSSYEGVMLASQLEAFVNANRDPKKQPFLVDRPWEETAGRAPKLPEGELLDLVAKLEARSAFRDRD
jgi:hypothetical protein